MDVFHIIVPLKHASILKKLLSEKLSDRKDIFSWSCISRYSADPMCAACESIPEDFMKYINMLDLDREDRYFFWRVEKDTGKLIDTNAASALSSVGSVVGFKDLVMSLGYRLRKIDG